MEQGSRGLQYLTAFCVSIAAVASGVSLNWNTPVLPKFHDNETNIQITDSELSWLASICSPGFVAGSVITRFTSDKYGRRATLLGSALPIAVGSILIAISANIWMLYVGRFLWGCGTGAIGTVSSIYIAEIADKDIRGRLTLMLRYMSNLGGFLIMAIGPSISYKTLNYLVMALEDRLTQMRADVKKEMSRTGSIKELFTGQRYRKAVIIILGLKLAQMMSGANAIAQYLGRITQESKSSLSVSTVLVIFGAVRFALSVTSSVLIDRIGRRPLLIYSYFGSGVALAMVGAYFFKQEVMGFDTKQSSLYGFIPFIGIIIYSIISCLGFQSVVYMIPAELFPLNVKSLAMTFSNILGGLLNFVTVKCFQPLKDVAGLCGVFWFYAFISLIGAVFSFYFVPETKGKSLREIQFELQGNVYDETAENLKVPDDKEIVKLGGIQVQNMKDW